MAPKHVIILDGGLSRELIRLDAPFRQPEWSAAALLESPDLVRTAHQNFVAAGAQVITTNSYALVPFHIGDQIFAERGKDLAALSGKLAREAAGTDGKVRVAGCLPPLFGSYEPQRFDATRADCFLEALIAGLEPWVDFWLGETLSLIAEAQAVCKATERSGKDIWIAFTLADDRTEESNPRLRSGESVEDAARWVLQSGVKALLFNCSTAEIMESAVRTTKTVFGAQEECSVPLIGVYANTFVPLAAGEEKGSANESISAIRTDLTEAKYTAFAQRWVDCGASIVGGCCGVGPEYIHHLAEHLH